MALTADAHILPSPYVDLDRDAWARLRRNHPMSLSAEDVTRLRGLGDRLDLDEVEHIYLPLSRLLSFYVEATTGLHRVTTTFLGEPSAKTPFVLAVAGSVAVGKSTTARILKELLSRWPSSPRVELVTTDGFLFPNAELERRGLLQRKGFPESYDRRALLRFVADVKSGVPEVRAPVYSHLTYDIVPGERIVVRRPDVLIVEGLNVLQAPSPREDGRNGLALSDFFDFSVYVDAAVRDIRAWYVDRFLRLRETAFADPASYFHRYAALSDDEARATATGIWQRINEPNLRQNVKPTRGRAHLILSKDESHAVERIRLRKL
ncbi:pantothenate kinase [Nostocoides japonicum T1-X7]|uniref:Pantothenate kinase n=1 Tax=Nostocoides japonicum T1-X7 TaxID=1194083 RepID=A0A077LW63_9MICO|nr:type I pantothenate kinase [Tetrasphaera japonica]CCH77067.1 pantothenate kinase [Tetrasphaera japonica T1-X7]CCH79397.1 pantothenate kinase [Tetrasphaera japonica T1-X7]